MTSRIRGSLARRPIVSFFVLAFAFTWALDAPVVLLGMEVGWASWGLFTVGALGPAVAAAVVLWAGGGDVRAWARQVVAWRRPARWYAAVLGLPVVLLVLGTAIYAAAGGPVSLRTLDLGPAFYASLPLLILWEAVVGGGKEEPGWRGFAQPYLQARYSAVTAALVVGVLWALWHLPLFLTPAAPHGNWPVGQQVAWGVGIVGLAVIHAWLYNRTGSVWLNMLLHGAWNVVSMLVPLNPDVVYVDGVADAWLVSLAVWAVAAATWLVALALVARDGRDLTRGAVPGPDRFAPPPAAAPPADD